MRIVYIPNPVDDRRVTQMAGDTSVQHPWFGGQTPLVVAVGRLAAAKSYDVLLNAVASVNREWGKCRLLILGDGSLRIELAEVADRLGLSEVVQFTGEVMNPFPYIAAAQVFALSSSREGLPTALIEAAILGRPLVATDCQSGPREILRDGLDGELVPVGDSRRVAEALVRQIEHPRYPSAEAVAPYRPTAVIESYVEVLSS